VKGGDRRIGDESATRRDASSSDTVGRPSPVLLVLEETRVDDAERAVLAEMAGAHGLITAARAEQLGMARTTIWRRRRSGVFVADQPGVLRASGAPRSLLTDLAALVLSTGGVASHRAAAALYGIDGFRLGVLEVTVAEHCHQHREGRVIVHRSTQLDLAEPRHRLGIAVTGPERTLIDLGAVVSARRLEQAVDDLLRRGLVTWPSIYRWFVRHAARGRNGVGPMRELLGRRYGDDDIPLSAWSRWVAELLVDAGLPMPCFEYRITDTGGGFIAQVDLAYPEFRIAVELIGKKGHLNAEAFERDPVRLSAITNAGWRVHSVTWRRYIEQPVQLVATIRDAIAAASAVPPFQI
jgi:hypothetical protein